MKTSTNTYISVLGIKFTVKKKHMRWHIAFTSNGKRISRSTGLEATKLNLMSVKTEVLPQIAQELVSMIQATSDVENTDDTVLENFAEDHFALHKESVRAHVFARDISNYSRHILPYFKGRTLDSIKSMELELWQNRLLSKYKMQSVQKYRSIFYSIFTRAYNNSVVLKNPFDTVTAPKMKQQYRGKDKNTVNPFTKKEIDTLVNYDDGTYMVNFIKFMSNTGMRPGEIIALTWDDINFEDRTVNVDKTTINGSIGLPKTQSSIRVIDMIIGAFEALQEQYKLTSDNEYVFVSSNNTKFYSHDIINLNFKKRLKLHNIPVRPLYQLRHSFASRMIRSGIDITWVSKTLGHQDSSITLQVYTKFIVEDEDTRLKNLEKINKQLDNCCTNEVSLTKVTTNGCQANYSKGV